MCLYPRLMKNPRFKGANMYKCKDPRQLYVPVGCGNCMECRRQKAQQWKVRLHEEMKVQKYAYFITLTFAPDELEKLCKETFNTETNATATIAVRRFLERWRKKYGKSLRHWLITELGHEGTERIHLHGIIFPECEITNTELQEIWKYGFSDIGQYCNAKSINYIVKYVTKIDTAHTNYKAVILCSAGLGNNFTKSHTALYLYKYEKGKTPEYYQLPNGLKVALPTYYRNKLYSEKERQQMWSDRLDKNEIWVNGIQCKHIDTPQGLTNYYNVLRQQQRDNIALGYGDLSEKWRKETYNVTLRMLNKAPHAYE